MEHSSTFDWLQSSDSSGAPRVERREGLSRKCVTDNAAHRIFRWALPFAAAVAAFLVRPASAQTVVSGLRNEVVLTEYSPLCSTTELVRRLLSPLTALRLNQEAQRAGQTLRGQAIDLARERYSIHIPASPHSPSGTYSLLVFVPPWPRAEVPRQWISVLDRYHTILVTAANSGNDAPTIDRREPLALLAAHNTMKQYPVDPQRVYIGGFSGGARVALRLALGYPDVFHGALLNAGSDPVGSADVPLPPADLFRLFQESTRLVYVTGERDEAHLIDDMQSRRSLEKWCVFDVVTEAEPRMEHEVADASAFSRSLDALLSARQTHPGKLADCRARIDKELSMQLEQVESEFARGDSNTAEKQLAKIDARYGGLAAPRSVDLASR
jgi:pimeloyl-ACP methyl ester carboxylesterase